MARASEPTPRLEWHRTVSAKTLNDYNSAEVIPPYTEFVPDGPGQWYLDGEPITAEEAQALMGDGA